MNSICFHILLSELYTTGICTLNQIQLEGSFILGQSFPKPKSYEVKMHQFWQNCCPSTDSCAQLSVLKLEALLLHTYRCSQNEMLAWCLSRNNPVNKKYLHQLILLLIFMTWGLTNLITNCYMRILSLSLGGSYFSHFSVFILLQKLPFSSHCKVSFKEHFPKEMRMCIYII